MSEHVTFCCSCLFFSSSVPHLILSFPTFLSLTLSLPLLQLILNRCVLRASRVPGFVLNGKCVLVNLTAISSSSRAHSPMEEGGQ